VEVDVNSLSLTYLESTNESLKIVGQPAVKTDESGCQTISFSVKKPEIHKNIFLQYNYISFPTADVTCPLPWYWTAHLMHRTLEVHSEDGSLRTMSDAVKFIQKSLEAEDA
jgi:hypothetical protein